MEKQRKQKISGTFRKLSGIYFFVGFWTTKDKQANFSRIFLCLLFSLFTVSTAVQSCTTNNTDESVLLAVATSICTVQIYRLYCIIWNQRKIIDLMYASGTSSTNDYGSICNAKKKLTNFEMFVRYFLGITLTSSIFTTFMPIVNKQLMFNVAFPLDYTNNEMAFWAAHVFVSSSFTVSVICCVVTTMIWYIMLNVVLKLELLGSDLKNLGVAKSNEGQVNPSTNRLANNTLYSQHLIDAIKNLENINECAAKVS